MQKTRKKILIIFITICIITGLSLASFLFIAYKILSPDKLTTTVRNHLKESFGQDVSIGEAKFSFLNGPRVILTNVHIVTPEGLTLDTKRLNANFSLWDILFGKIRITHLGLVNPDVTIQADTLIDNKGAHKIINIPDLDITDGSLNLVYKGTEILFKNCSGRTRQDKIDITANTLGGSISINAYVHQDYSVKVNAENINLNELDPDFKGISSLIFDINLKNNKFLASLAFKTQDLFLPWSDKGIQEATLNINAEGTKDHILLTDISLKTPLIEVSGKGDLSELYYDNLLNSNLKLDMLTNEFDYEQVLNMLPAGSFPHWLNKLLTSQIRGGTSRFPTVQYKGSLADLMKAEPFLNNIYVVQDLINQSFGATYGPERVTNIKGQVIYTSGNIEFKDLTGFMGDSRIEKVGLKYYGVVLPGDRLSVDVDLAMDAKDFIDTWRAAMVPENLFELLAPVSNVTSGTVSGKVSVNYDEFSSKPVELMGNISLDNCSYSFGSHTISSHTGTINSPNFDTPADIHFTVEIDTLTIEQFDMTLESPFNENLYSFYIKTNRLPDTDVIKIAQGSLVIVKGTGKGPDILGTIEISSDGLDLFGDYFTPKQKPILGKGKIQGTLWPDLIIEINNFDIHVATNTVGLSAKIKNDEGDVNLKGSLNLEHINSFKDTTLHPSQGSIGGNLKISWGKHVYMKGSIRCNKAHITYKNSDITVDGLLKMDTNIITGDSLNIIFDDLKMNASGSLNIEEPFYYQGNITIDGLKINDETKTKTTDFFKKFNANAALTLTNFDLWGIPIDKVGTIAVLKGGILTLSSIEASGTYGVAKGSTIINQSGTSTFDIIISLKNARVRQFLHALSPGQAWIDGDMDLEGHLWGSIDSLNGSLLFTAREGKIQKYALLSNIFTLLNFYKIIQSQELELTSKNFHYNFISSIFNIKDSIMTFDNFYMDSNSLQLSAVGEYSLKTRNIDSIVGIQPLESFDKTINMIPLIGNMLTGKDGKLLVVSMNVKGNIDNPSVQFQPLETISKPLKSSLMRALKISSDIIEKTEKIIEKSGKIINEKINGKQKKSE